MKRRDALIMAHQEVAAGIRQNVDNGCATSPEVEAAMLELAGRHDRIARQMKAGHGRAAR